MLMFAFLLTAMHSLLPIHDNPYLVFLHALLIFLIYLRQPY
jgi:hypothetical protein